MQCILLSTSDLCGQELVVSTRMCSEGYSTWSVCVCLSVRPSVSSYSCTTGFEVANERYQRLQNYASLKKKKAIFLKRLRSRDMP